VTAQLAFFALDVATAFAAVLLGLRALQRWRLPAAQLVVIIAFDSFCDVALGRSDYSWWIPAALQINIHGVAAVIFNIARNLTPFLFAAFCFMEFADRPRFPRWLYPLLAIQLFFEVAARWFIPSAAPDITPANYYQHVALVFSHLVLLVFVLFQFSDSGIDTYLDPLRRPVPQPPVTSPDAAALARLAALMQEERLYRRGGLTLKALADKVGIPEYRLRRLIHEQLGFANFNAYLHAWRVREACEQLRDPAQRRTPILTVALSVGYNSVNTFNRGFREVTGTAPSAWRADENAPVPPSPKTA